MPPYATIISQEKQVKGAVMGLRYAVHAYAWTTSWSNDTLDLIDRAKRLGFDLIEIPLMEIEKVDPVAIKRRLAEIGLGVCTSTACSESNDITGEDETTRRRGVEYLRACVKATADMGASCFSGVIYSAIGRKIAAMPGEEYWNGRQRTQRSRPLCSGLWRHHRHRTHQPLRDVSGQHLRSGAAPQYDRRAERRHPSRRLSHEHRRERFLPPDEEVAAYIAISPERKPSRIPGQGTVDWESIYRH
jgi:D-psicose/D-tagatose/L-ribulose 3-epimerase